MNTASNTAGDTTVVQVVQPSASSPFINRWIRRIRYWPVVPIIIISALLIAAIFADQLTSYDPEKDDLISRNIPPIWQEGGDPDHLLGTDPLGRDMLTRIIHGARISLLIAAIVLSIGTAIGLLVGLVAGYLGGTLDEVLMRIVDFTFAVPFILVALVTVIVYGQSFTLVIVLLTIFSWNGVARQARAETLSLKTRDYVAASLVAGASIWRIMYRHVMPGPHQHRHRGHYPETRLPHPHRSLSVLPRRRHPTTHTGMGRDGCGGAQLHLHRVVDILLPRIGHHAHGASIQLLGRLVQRSLRPAPSTT